MNKANISNTLVLLLILMLPLFCYAQDKKDPMLCVGHYQTEQEAKEQLSAFAEEYKTLEEWEIKASVIREGILKGAELFPLPGKCNLNPVFTPKRIYEGYSVENVAFESLHGVFVTGSLYRPTELFILMQGFFARMVIGVNRKITAGFVKTCKRGVQVLPGWVL